MDLTFQNREKKEKKQVLLHFMGPEMVFLKCQ